MNMLAGLLRALAMWFAAFRLLLARNDDVITPSTKSGDPEALLCFAPVRVQDYGPQRTWGMSRQEKHMHA